MDYLIVGGVLLAAWMLFTRPMTPDEARRSKRIKFTRGLISCAVVVGLLWWMSFVFRLIPL